MSYPMGPSNPSGNPAYGPPPAGGYGGGYGQPPGFGPPPGPGGFGGPPPGFGGGDRVAAEGKVKPAAITLMVFTGIGMLIQLVSLFMNVLGTGVNLANGGNHSSNNDAAAQLMSGAMGIVMNIVGLLAGGFCIYAFLKMMKLQGRGLAYTAIIFSMLPCLGSCWCVNLWIGIWALIAMSDQNVKASFT